MFLCALFCFAWIFLQIYNTIQLHSSRCSKWCQSTAVTLWIGTLLYFIVIQYFLIFSNQRDCARVNLRRYNVQSFSAEVGSRGYHVYLGSNWTNLVIHQPFQVSIEISAISKTYDPYYCQITITRRNRVGSVTVGHISLELLRFVCYFLWQGALQKTWNFPLRMFSVNVTKSYWRNP